MSYQSLDSDYQDFHHLLDALLISPLKAQSEEDKQIANDLRLFAKRYPFARSNLNQVLQHALHSDRVAHIFYSAYQVAVSRLTGLEAGALAFCYSEKNVRSPRKLQAQYSLKLKQANAYKSYIAGAELAQDLVLVCKKVDDFCAFDDAALFAAPLVAVVLTQQQPGFELIRHEKIEFIPEYEHAAGEFINCDVHQELPGDAYSQYVKPMRVYETFYFAAGLLALMLRVAGPEVKQKCIAQLHLLHCIEPHLDGLDALSELALWQAVSDAKALFTQLVNDGDNNTTSELTAFFERLKRDSAMLFLIEQTLMLRANKLKEHLL